MQSIFIKLLLSIAMLFATPQVIEAYVGPGAGIAAIGTVVALIGGVILAIVGFIWYPIKRLLVRAKQKRKNHQGDTKT